jgi:hypothetical protein
VTTTLPLRCGPTSGLQPAGKCRFTLPQSRSHNDFHSNESATTSRMRRVELAAMQIWRRHVMTANRNQCKALTINLPTSPGEREGYVRLGFYQGRPAAVQHSRMSNYQPFILLLESKSIVWLCLKVSLHTRHGPTFQIPIKKFKLGNSPRPWRAHRQILA